MYDVQMKRDLTEECSLVHVPNTCLIFIGHSIRMWTLIWGTKEQRPRVQISVMLRISYMKAPKSVLPSSPACPTDPDARQMYPKIQGRAMRTVLGLAVVRFLGRHHNRGFFAANNQQPSRWLQQVFQPPAKWPMNVFQK